MMRRMFMRIIRLAIVPMAAALLLCGCGDRQCEMQVHTEQKGISTWSGQTDREDDYSLELTEGCIVYEWQNNSLRVCGADETDSDMLDEAEGSKVFRVVHIGLKEITLETDDGETEVKYGEKYTPKPLPVHDVPSPVHDIVFGRQ